VSASSCACAADSGRTPRRCLAAVRALNRVELVGETMRHALNRLALLTPDWTQALSQPEWVELYARRAEDLRWPKGQQAREALALAIGTDGARLLTAAYGPDAPAWLREVLAVQTLRRVWVQNFYQEGEQRRWRTEVQGIPPSATFVSSPYDPDAHCARKRSTQWVGYKSHLTETCEEDVPCLMTDGESATGPTADEPATPIIHAHLEDQGLLPDIHLVDTGYRDGPLMADRTRDDGVALSGPARLDPKGHATSGQGRPLRD
jgi:transposase